MNVGLIYGYDHHIIGRYLEEAFAGMGGTVRWEPAGRGRPGGYAPDVEILELLTRTEGVELILHAEGHPMLPRGIERVQQATACLQIDAWVGLRYRLLYASLFDAVFVYHERFLPAFSRAGHPRVFLLPHAADTALFRDADPAGGRELDVGWVGTLRGPLYGRRREILPVLARRVRMNDWERRYSREAMADVLKRSKVVVNVSRDDLPEDANMRCFEAMAAGALLLTGLPSELQDLGFRDGVDFVGFRDREDLWRKLDHYLSRDEERIEIATRGRARVLAAHTYEHRAERIGRVTERCRGHAPARGWAHGEADLAYLAYYLMHGLWRCAARRLVALPVASPHQAMRAVPLVSRRLVRRALDAVR